MQVYQMALGKENCLVGNLIFFEGFGVACSKLPVFERPLKDLFPSLLTSSSKESHLWEMMSYSLLMSDSAPYLLSLLYQFQSSGFLPFYFIIVWYSSLACNIATYLSVYSVFCLSNSKPSTLSTNTSSWFLSFTLTLFRVPFSQATWLCWRLRSIRPSFDLPVKYPYKKNTTVNRPNKRARKRLIPWVLSDDLKRFRALTY